jgi:hypothetical protein
VDDTFPFFRDSTVVGTVVTMKTASQAGHAFLSSKDGIDGHDIPSAGLHLFADGGRQLLSIVKIHFVDHRKAFPVVSLARPRDLLTVLFRSLPICSLLFRESLMKT